MKYNNLLTSEPNKLSWRYLKTIVKDITYLRNLINIANTYIKLNYWLSHFKKLLSIIIPKPNYHKMNYLLICDIWTLGILLEV